MDPDSPASRVERTFWTVWYYVADAFNRFLRTEPANAGNNDQGPLRQPVPDSVHPEVEYGGRTLAEEQRPATATLLSSLRPVVAWELCDSDIDLGPEQVRGQSQLSRGAESKVSEEGERTGEEHVAQTGNAAAGLLVFKIASAEEAEMSENGDGDSYTLGQRKASEDEQPATMGPLNLIDDAEEEDVEGSTRRISREEEIRSCALADSRSELKDCVSTGEPRLPIDVVVVACEDVQNRVAASDLASENKNKCDEGAEQVENQFPVDKDFKMATKTIDKGSEHAGEEWVAAAGDSADKRALREAPEEEDAEGVAQKNQESIIEQVECNDEVQNTEGELGTAEFSDQEEEYVAEDTKVQTQTSEAEDADGSVVHETSHVPPADILVQEGLYDYIEVEGESFPGGGRDGEGHYPEIACSTTPATLTPEGEAAQEIRGDSENIPPEINEGLGAESQELNCPTSEETRVGVPGHNNGPRPEENPTQRVLEVGYGEGAHTTQLREEVESNKWESLRNTDTPGDFIPTMERREEEEENAGDIVEVPQFKEAEGSRHSSEDETMSNSSTETNHSEELETHLGETEEMRIQSQDGPGSDGEIDEGLSGFRDAAYGFSEETLKIFKSKEGTTEKSRFQESLDALSFERNDSATSSSEDMAETRVAKMPDEDETKLVEGGVAERHDTGRDAEETDCGVAGELVEDELQDINELETFGLQVADDSLDMKCQPSLVEASDEVRVAGPGAAADLTEAVCRAEDATVEESETEGNCVAKRSGSVDGREYVIDEEKFDSWLETVLLKDKNGTGRPETEHAETEPSNEEPVEMSPRRAEDKLGELMSGESGLLSDSEISSSTAGSELWDLSVGEWVADHSGTQPMKSSSTGSPQGSHETWAGVPETAAVSGLSPQRPKIVAHESLEYESLAETEFSPDSGVVSSDTANQEPDESQDETDEDLFQSVETENIIIFRDDKTQVEDAAPGVALSGISEDEIAHAESGPSGCGSEALFHAEIMPAESQVDTFTEAEKLLKVSFPEEPQAPAWSEAIPEVEEEEPTTGLEDHAKVDTSALDFSAQRFRIAVKDPRVRPPTDPRSLLNMPSVDPTPSSSLPVRSPKGVPLGGMGLGIKLPGLGAGFPVLKKVQRADENSSKILSRGLETETEEKSDSPQKDDAPHKPRWMPPKHPGFGNPLMSELKTKLKKTTEE